MAEPRCPQCGAREWKPPPPEKRQIVFSTWQVVCVKCGYETWHTLGMHFDADDEDRREAEGLKLFAFYGTFTSDQPGHESLAGAQLIGDAQTAPRYRLLFVDDVWPAIVEADDGVTIAVELYECTEELLAHLADVEPPGWNRAPLELADGRQVEAFLGDEGIAARGVDVSAHGSWAAFVARSAG